jgi:DNA-damage-inducible protein J
MAKTATTHARMDPEIKREAERIIKDMGLSISAAHEMFYRQIIAHQGLPFDLRIPNKETLAAIEEARQGIGTKYSTVQEMLEDL